MPFVEDKLLKPGEAAKQLGVSAQAVRDWAAKRLIDHVVLPSGRIKVSQATVDAMAAKGRNGLPYTKEGKT